MRLLPACIAGVLLACATTSGAGSGAGGSDSLSLSLRTTGDQLVRLPDGRPHLVFLFATFDDASQLALTPLVAFHQRRPDVDIVGVALQPDPGPLLESYANALAIDFTLGTELQDTLLSGHSALRDTVTVPMCVAVDAQGQIVETLIGVPTQAQLELLAATLDGTD